MFDLNQLIKANKVFVFSDRKSKDKDQLISDIKKLSSLLESKNESHVGIYCRDTYIFTVYFFASILAGKNITIYSSEKDQSWEKEYLEFLLDTEFWPSMNKLEQESSVVRFTADSEVNFFTSGTTGKPKRIKKYFSQLYKEAEVLENQFSANKEDVNIISTVSHLHIYGFLFKVLWPLSAGYPILNDEIFFPEDFNKLELNKKYFLISSPAFLKRLDMDLKFSLSLVRLFSSGGLLRKETAQQSYQYFNVFPTEVLGSTETGGVAYRNQSHNSGELWSLFDCITAELGVDSRLSIHSPFVSETPYLMSDCVEFINENQFILKSRVDRIVKIEEKRVSLQQLEDKLREHEYVRDCSVVAIETNGRQQTAALICLKEKYLESETYSKSELNSQFRTYLAKYFELLVVPKRYKYENLIPRNAQDKVGVQEVKGMFL